LKTLFIYNGEIDKLLNINNTDFTYNINNGKINSSATCIDNSKKLHEIAIDLRDRYIDKINSFNNYFIKHKLLYQNNISMFFFSDIFNKRTERFNTYLYVCHITLIKEFLLKNKKIKKIVSINCNSNFNESLQSISADHDLIIKKEIKINNNFFKLYLSHLKFFSISIIKLIFIKKHTHSKHNINSTRILLSRFPLHFDSQLNEEKYGDYYDQNKDIFFSSIITDGLHQNLSIKETLKYIKKIKYSKKIILIDSYLTFWDLVRGFIYSINLVFKSKKLVKHTFYFEGINIKGLLKKEIKFSFLRIPRLLVYKNAIIKLVKEGTYNKFTFYLHEYSYGQFFNYIFAKYFPDIVRVGFQHGPASNRKLLYFLGKNIISNSNNDWVNKTPIPDKVLAEDKDSKNIYKYSGYKNVKNMKNIYRLSYLNTIIRKPLKKKTILIVPGLHDEIILINRLKKNIIQNQNINFIFKPHPRGFLSKNSDNIPIFNNLKVGSKHISHYLSFVNEVFCTYSSVGIEAYKLNIPVTIVCFQNKINESPLLDLYLKKENININILW